uniref:Uncharacterized protein n=1 Tax=Romanomermis culicivorax TaxID=13658 RepID=A0A915K9D3_ROMCU
MPQWKVGRHLSHHAVDHHITKQLETKNGTEKLSLMSRTVSIWNKNSQHIVFAGNNRVLQVRLSFPCLFQLLEVAGHPDKSRLKGRNGKNNDVQNAETRNYIMEWRGLTGGNGKEKKIKRERDKDSKANTFPISRLARECGRMLAANSRVPGSLNILYAPLRTEQAIILYGIEWWPPSAVFPEKIPFEQKTGGAHRISARTLSLVGEKVAFLTTALTTAFSQRPFCAEEKS